jgi:hypothetical protein
MSEAEDFADSAAARAARASIAAGEPVVPWERVKAEVPDATTMRRPRMARMTFWLARQLMRIPTRQSIPSLGAGGTVTQVRAWAPCRASMRLLALAARIDPEHFDHWASVYQEWDPRPCAECGGIRPGPEWEG